MKRTVKHSCRGSRQAYMNKTKFIPDKHKKDNERLNSERLSEYTSLCCQRCSQIIKWKINYGHYQPLAEMRKCNLCECKTIIFAYHHICQNCSEREAKCVKCQKHVLELPTKSGEKTNTFLNCEDANLVSNNLLNSNLLELKQDNIANKLVRLHGLDTNLLEKRLLKEQNAQTESSVEGLRERDRRTFYRRAAPKE